MATQILMTSIPTAHHRLPLADVSMMNNKPQCMISRKRSSSAICCPIMFRSSNKRARTTTCTTSTTCSKQKKSVRFDMAQNTTEVVDRTHHDTDTLWFSAQELSKIRHREAHVLHNHRSSDYYVHQITQLLGMACHSTTTSTTSVAIKDAISFVSSSTARGLEKEAVACVRQRRKQVIRTFLQSQHVLLQRAHQFSPDYRATALSRHYQKLARPAVRLAQMIAHGDAMVALSSS
ncbi:expressed unknown protein [Seminavis robusta]|uniref:Uncharacterized protein n=1 Tax=Seminavis robusta TaxID=568900 RepID=A0A9N8EGJ0_9STRA|nr:expressed unknown protein [Seminavis robusta]|eukprot:Sro904_g218390.1 n/a (234) ;mRNA; f:23854-24555